MIYNTKERAHTMTAPQKCRDTSHWHTICPRINTQPFARLELTVHVLEDVENREDLPVVGHKSLSHHFSRHHQKLQDLQGGADHLAVPRVQGIWRTRAVIVTVVIVVVIVAAVVDVFDVIVAVAFAFAVVGFVSVIFFQD